MKRQSSLRLPSIISDGMILQQNKPVTIWGWDEPSHPVRVAFEGQEKEQITSAEGIWEIVFETLPSGGPYQMTIEGSATKVISDIYVGEVWLAGGQSNMELPLNRTLDLYEADIQKVDNPLIREFHVPITYRFGGPQAEEAEPASWKKATQESIGAFSAIGYFFAQRLQEELQVPVGIIMTAVGGTRAEAWLDKEDIKEMPDIMSELEQLYDKEWIKETQKSDEARIQTWYETLNQKETAEWQNPQFDESKWKNINVPTMFHETELAGRAGSIWFRKTFHVEDAEPFKEDSLLRVGAIIDYDEAYLNGVFVGKTEYRYPPRRYPIPEGIIKQGENVLFVRIVLNGKTGGFISGKKYGIESKTAFLDLAGEWQYKRSVDMEELTQMTFFQNKPTGLYNSMLYPIKHYAHSGFLFYQGESNTHQPDRYADLFGSLVDRWRKAWQDADLPFLFVQLANYHDEMSLETDRRWAELRHQQALVEGQTKRTAMTVSIDVGEGNDLHPQNKKTLGERLAEDALQIAYGYPVSIPKPQVVEMVQEKTELSLQFNVNIQSANGPSQESFMEVEYDGKEWQYVNAKATENKIIIPTEEGKNVTGIRYGWSNNPENPPYFSENGYPVGPFWIKGP